MEELFRKLGFKSTAAPAGPVEYLIVGLGNPGREYQTTRHNAGFMAVDSVVKKLGISVDRIRFKGLCGEGTIAGKRVLFLKPSTFMNLSGESVLEAMQFYKLSADQVIVLYDDVSLEIGRLRIRRKGTDGGHNGIKNIILRTGRDDFPRVKIGVGQKPHADYDLADWVLSHFSDQDQKTLAPLLAELPDLLGLMVSGQLDEAMNRYNT